MTFSALKVFAWAENPNKPNVGPTTRLGIPQEQWCNLWRSGFWYYLCADPLGISWGSDRHFTI